MEATPVDDDGRSRRVVEHEHEVREEPVPAAEIDNAAAAKQASCPARDFPRFVKFLARQAPGGADGAPDPIEQRRAAESAEVVGGQAPAGCMRKRHARCYPFMMRP